MQNFPKRSTNAVFRSGIWDHREVLQVLINWSHVKCISTISAYSQAFNQFRTSNGANSCELATHRPVLPRVVRTQSHELTDANCRSTALKLRLDISSIFFNLQDVVILKPSYGGPSLATLFFYCGTDSPPEVWPWMFRSSCIAQNGDNTMTMRCE